MSEGTKVDLREYIEKIIELHFSESQRAIDKATEALNFRLESMNEFRTQINLERGNYITRTSFETEQRQRIADQRSLEHRLSILEGTCITRTSFETEQKQRTVDQKTVDDRISFLEGEFNKLQGNIQGRMYVFGALLAILAIVMRYI